MSLTGLRYLVLLAVIGNVCVAQSPRRVISLNDDWHFRTFPSASSSADGKTAPAAEIKDDTTIPTVALPNFDDGAWDHVSVPHEYPYNTNGASKTVYRGEAWYRKTFTPSKDLKGKRVFLRFDGVGISSETFLNGKRVGIHHGGFAAFTYEITDMLLPGQPNILAARVDNRLNLDVAPVNPSFLYGGIYRNVSLIVTGPINITPMDYSSPGVFLTQTSVTHSQAVVNVKTEVNSSLSSNQRISVRLAVFDEAGKSRFKTVSTLPVPSSTTTAVNQTITISNPHLWNSVEDPYLYTAHIDLLGENGAVLDSVVQPLGLRFFKFDAQKGFILNGVARQIHGVCLHQDFADMGIAIGPAQEKQDLDILREMGADGLRLVHYQHSQSALDLYDRTGMLTWSEIPNFFTTSATPGYRDSVRQQLIEMIRQNYNHPSIIIWSLFNELDFKTSAVGTPLVIELGKLAHQEDSTRPMTGAASEETINKNHEMVASLDLISDNGYPGYYFGTPDIMGSQIDKYNAMYGNRGIGITEYGGGGKITNHQQGLTPHNMNPTPANSAVQPEEWESILHEADYTAMKERPFVWGVFPWLAFDAFGIPRGDGTYIGGNTKGLVTQDRKTRKDAFFFYQANWATKPMLYLTSRRDVDRTDPNTLVKVYSNSRNPISLSVNGKSYGEQSPDAMHIARWPNVTLTPGANKVEVHASGGLSDEVTWMLKP